MTSYINNQAGNRMAADVIRLAAELQDSPGDGRISKADAKQLADKLNDGGILTDPERRALDHLKRTGKVNFTPAAYDDFVHEMRSKGAERGWVTRLANEAQTEDQKDLGSATQSMLDARMQQQKPV